MDTATKENTDDKVQVGLRMEPELHAIITDMAAKEDRTFSNMLFRLLKTNPQIEPLLTAEPATAGAGN